MSDISLNFEDFEDYSNFDHFETDLTLLPPDSGTDSQHILNEAKFYINVRSVEGIPSNNNNIGGFINGIYSLNLEMGNEKVKKHLTVASPQSSVHLVSDEHTGSSNFDLVDYYGLTMLKFILKNKNPITGHKRVVGEVSVSLSELMNKQAGHDKTCTLAENASWTVSDCVSMETDLMIRLESDCDRNRSNNKNTTNSSHHSSWLATAKSAAGMSPSLVGASSVSVPTIRFPYGRANKKSQQQPHQSGFATASLALRVKIRYQFRLISLQHCLQLRPVALRPDFLKLVNLRVAEEVSSAKHLVSDLHGFLTTAQTHEVVALLHSLAASQSLSRALRLQSSSGYTALEWALLAGNESAVTVILQRAGNLCFRDLVPGVHGPFHAAVLGGSKACVETLWRFFKKYSGSNAISYPAGTQHWSPTLTALLEWRDEVDHTPLSLACSFPAHSRDTGIVELLLFAGASISAVNHRSDFTPLMVACHSGATAAVRVLLSIVRSSVEMDDILYAVSTSVVSNNHDNALQRHLRSNARSRNILKGRDSTAGGFLNPLSMYCCDPSHREMGDGRQAIHIAAARGHGEIVCMLLDIGVSCAETDRHGDNIFHLLALGGHHQACLNALRNEKAQWLAHASVVRDRHLQTMATRRKALLVANYRGRSAVEVAVLGGHFALALLLLETALSLYGFDISSSTYHRYEDALRLLREMVTRPDIYRNRHAPPTKCDVNSSSDYKTRPLSVERNLATATHRRHDNDNNSQQEEKDDDRIVSVSSDTLGLSTTGRHDSGEISHDVVHLILSTLQPAIDVAGLDSRSSRDDGELSTCEGEKLSSARHEYQEEQMLLYDDAADHEEYMYALSALALKSLGEVSAPAALDITAAGAGDKSPGQTSVTAVDHVS